jgi:hypothetical protein
MGMLMRYIDDGREFDAAYIERLTADDVQYHTTKLNEARVAQAQLLELGPRVVNAQTVQDAVIGMEKRHRAC